MQTPTYTISRGGTFTVPIYKGASHCGNVEGSNTFRYEVNCTMPEEGLDDNGFVLDALDIQTYFDEKYVEPLMLSCEAIARTAAKDIHNLLGERQFLCMKMSVKVWGLENSYIEYKWEKVSE